MQISTPRPWKCILMIVVAGLTLLAAATSRADIFPSVSITPDPLVFPDTRPLTCTEPQLLTVTNTGTGILPLVVFATRLSNTTDFSIASDTCTGQTVQPGASCTYTIAFCPSRAGNFTASITLLTFSQQIIASATLTGQAVQPEAVLAPSSIAFGHHSVGQPSEERIAVLSNPGTAALAITSILASGDFGVADDCGDTLAAGASCNLLISFAPPAAGDFTGEIAVTDDAAGSPQTIALSGTGIVPGSPDIGLSKTSIDFGTLPAGSTSSAHPVTVKSTGTAALTINAITPSASFAATDDCPDVMPSGTTCTISITVTPPAVGAVSGTLLITDNATDSPQSIALNAVGVNPGAPQASLSTTAIDFGQQAVNTAAPIQTVTITNSGSADLVIASVTIQGEAQQLNDESAYSEIDDCSEATLPSGQSCLAEITFKPQVEGQQSASLVITDNAADSPQLVILTGTGVSGGGSGGGCSLLASGAAPSSWATLAAALATLAIARRRSGRS